MQLDFKWDSSDLTKDQRRRGLKVNPGPLVLFHAGQDSIRLHHSDLFAERDKKFKRSSLI